MSDNYDLESSHVMPALIRKFHEAKANHESEVAIWGNGSQRREFMAELTKDIINYNGRIVYDSSRPNCTPQSY